MKLQNIPVRTEEGRALRAALTPQSPSSIDYSQVELRMLMNVGEWISVEDIGTQEMRYTLRAVGVEVGRLSDEEVRVEFKSRFGPFVRRNPNHADPYR